MARVLARSTLSLICLFAIAVSAALAAPFGASNRAASTLVIGITQFPDNLNPFQTTLTVSADVLSGTMANLTAIDRRGRLVPELLQAIPSRANGGVRDGGRTVILRLRPHQYWSSGAEITSADLRFGWQVGMQRASGPACLSTCAVIRSIDLPNPYEAVLHLLHADGNLIPFGFPPLIPHSWRALGRTPKQVAERLYQNTSFSYESRRYWTNGPFQVRMYVINQRIVLQPMKHYALPPLPSLRRITFRFYPDAADLLQGLQTGQVDVGQFDPVAAAPQIQQAATDGLHIVIQPNLARFFTLFNVGSAMFRGQPNPLHDVRVRQALALATDRPALTAALLGMNADQARVLAAYSPFLDAGTFRSMGSDPRIDGAWDPIIRQYVPYGDLALRDARILLQQAGYDSGPTIQLATYSRSTWVQSEGQQLLEDWNRIGVHTDLAIAHYPLDPWDRPSALSQGDFEAFLWGNGVGPDPAGLRLQIETERGDTALPGGLRRFNYAGISDPVIDQALERATRQTDIARRVSWYRIIERRIVRQAYWLPLFDLPVVYAVAPTVRHINSALRYDPGPVLDFTRLRGTP